MRRSPLRKKQVKIASLFPEKQYLLVQENGPEQENADEERRIGYGGWLAIES